MSDDTGYENAIAVYEYWLKLMTEIKDEGRKKYLFVHKKVYIQERP